MKRRQVASVVPSPNGKQVAWIETRAIMLPELSAFQGILYVGDVDGKNSRRMTFGKYHASNPAWSPDGRWIAYTSTGADLKTQLNVMRSDGGEQSYTLNNIVYETGVDTLRIMHSIYKRQI